MQIAIEIFRTLTRTHHPLECLSENDYVALFKIARRHIIDLFGYNLKISYYILFPNFIPVFLNFSKFQKIQNVSSCDCRSVRTKILPQ